MKCEQNIYLIYAAVIFYLAKSDIDLRFVLLPGSLWSYWGWDAGAPLLPSPTLSLRGENMIEDKHPVTFYLSNTDVYYLQSLCRYHNMVDDDFISQLISLAAALAFNDEALSLIAKGEDILDV